MSDTTGTPDAADAPAGDATGRQPPPARDATSSRAVSRPFVLLALLALLLSWNAWERDFWSQGEVRAAAVTRDMVRTGSWAVPQLGGEAFLKGPPLLYWLAGGLESVLGADPRWVYRLPVILAAILSLWLTYWAGVRLFTPRVGILAALVLASNYFFFRSATWFDDDLMFAAFCQLALTGWVLHDDAGGAGTWDVLGWLGLAAAALVKSLPLAALLVVGVWSLYLFFGGGLEALLRGYGAVFRTRGALLFAALVVPWYALVLTRHSAEFCSSHLVAEHYARLVGRGGDDGRPVYFYLLQIAVGFLPWSLFAPAGILHAKDRLRRSGERFAIMTVLFPCVVLSIASAKNGGYVLLAWPALSLLVAAAAFETRERFSLWEGFLKFLSVRAARYLLLGFFLAALGVAALFVVDLLVARALTVDAAAWVVGAVSALPADGRERLALELGTTRSLISALLLVLLAGASTFVYARRMRRSAARDAAPEAMFELAVVTLFVLFLSSFFYSGFNTFKSSRAFMARVESRVGDAPLAIYGPPRSSVYYYLTRPPQRLARVGRAADADARLERLREYVSQPRAAFLIGATADVQVLQRDYPSLRERLEVVDRGALGWSREVVLVSNRR